MRRNKIFRILCRLKEQRIGEKLNIVNITSLIIILKKVEEKGGVIFRWLPSITGTDTWSNDCGYIGAVKRSYSFVYDKNKGLIQINSTIVDKTMKRKYKFPRSAGQYNDIVDLLS